MGDISSGKEIYLIKLHTYSLLICSKASEVMNRVKESAEITRFLYEKKFGPYITLYIKQRTKFNKTKSRSAI